MNGYNTDTQYNKNNTKTRKNKPNINNNKRVSFVKDSAPKLMLTQYCSKKFGQRKQ